MKKSEAPSLPFSNLFASSCMLSLIFRIASDSFWKTNLFHLDVTISLDSSLSTIGWCIVLSTWAKRLKIYFQSKKSPSSPSKSVTFCPLFPIRFLIDMGEGVEAFILSYSFKKKAKTHILSSRRKVWHVELQVLIAFSRGRWCCRWAALHIVKVRAAVLRRAKSSNRWSC